MITADQYSYKQDAAGPAFDDTHSLLVFDGKCVLCSGGAAKLMRWDCKKSFRYATAQSALGNSLLRHYGCDALTFNTVLVVAGGRAFTKSDAYIETARRLGGLWTLLTVLRVLPRAIRDPFYDWKARNRYKWFGQTEYCHLLPPEFADRVIDR